MKKIITSMALATALSAVPFLSAHAESVDGMLERGSPYSALFMPSPESGDLIGLAFENSSAAGKNIFNHCFTGIPCKILRAQLTEVAPYIEQTFKFEYPPSGWYLITEAEGVSMYAAPHFDEGQLATRYGKVHVNEASKQLFFRDQAVTELALVPVANPSFFQRIWQFIFGDEPKPTAVQGSQSLRIVASFEHKAEDVVLLQNTGGLCPAMFRFASITEKGLQITPEFGTCSDIFMAISNDDESITMTMTGFNSAELLLAPAEKGNLTKVVYHYAQNTVTKN